MNRFSGQGLLLFAFCFLLSVASHATSSDYPVFVAQIQNPNDYALFANSGWNGDWCVGFNKGWVKKFSNIPKGNYTRAFIGAKLGRMKALPPSGRPPQFKPIPGEIWTALSPTASWTKNQKRLLTSTADIPLESSFEYAIEEAGEAQWYWVEVPMKDINLSGDNYVALWSPSPEIVAVSSTPILAAGWGGKEVDTWIIQDIKGDIPNNPPMGRSNGLAYFQSSIALKLIRQGPPHPIKVRLLSWDHGTPDHLKPILTASVEGDSIERVWVESRSVQGNQWQRVGRSLWKAPYVFSVDQEKLPKGKVQLKVVAVNVWEEVGSSEPFEIQVSEIRAK